MGSCCSSASSEPPVTIEPSLTPGTIYHDTAYKWLTRSAGEPFPETAVTGGRDIDGCPIYVGRAYHDGDMIPAKVIPERNVAYVAHGGQEHAKHNFEVSSHSPHSLPSSAFVLVVVIVVLYALARVSLASFRLSAFRLSAFRLSVNNYL
jgi:hypothetical protein